MYIDIGVYTAWFLIRHNLQHLFNDDSAKCFWWKKNKKNSNNFCVALLVGGEGGRGRGMGVVWSLHLVPCHILLSLHLAPSISSYPSYLAPSPIFQTFQPCSLPNISIPHIFLPAITALAHFLIGFPHHFLPAMPCHPNHLLLADNCSGKQLPSLSNLF